MKMNAYGALQLFLWFICAFHIVVGVSANVPLVPLHLIAEYYGARVDWTPQFVYILKPLGAFMFVLGGLAAAAALQPLRQRAIVYGFVVLFAVRAMQRLVFQQEIYDAFAIPAARNRGSMVLFLVMAVALFALHRYVERQRTLAS